jgi:hypothetical protein
MDVWRLSLISRTGEEGRPQNRFRPTSKPRPPRAAGDFGRASYREARILRWPGQSKGRHPPTGERVRLAGREPVSRQRQGRPGRVSGVVPPALRSAAAPLDSGPSAFRRLDVGR